MLRRIPARPGTTPHRLLAALALAGLGMLGRPEVQAAVPAAGERAASVCSFRECGRTCMCRFRTWYEARPVRYGYGMTGDPAAAAYWYEKHAEQGDRRAAFNLGLLLRDGATGRAAQPERARALLRRAAETGLARAHLALGNGYRLGRFGEIATDKALTHYRTAAEAGLAKAQHAYANMLANGLGTPIDRVAAYKWYWLAGFKGLARSERALERLRADMSPAQRREGRSRAAAWREAH